MKIRVLGGGWYGCHLALALKGRGHDVELHEISDHLFAGASGANPARLHLGFHYPRSKLTRAACQDHQALFMKNYGFLTRSVQVNIYAIAEHDSQVDFGTYCQVLRGEVEFVNIVKPAEFGLKGVEGALLTGERHIVIDKAREFFEKALSSVVKFRVGPDDYSDYDWTIDCTFCANDYGYVDRYEPCVMGLLDGPTARAVTIMDGPFPSIYPWNIDRRLCSITSAALTPLSKVCKTYDEAKSILKNTSSSELYDRVHAMMEQMSLYLDGIKLYKVVDYRTGIRAMPKSAADARLVDVTHIWEEFVSVRAGKIDAIFHAEKMVCEMIGA